MNTEELNKKLAQLGLKRHIPVGKKMGNDVWVHISYAYLFEHVRICLEDYLECLGFNPSVIKISMIENKFSLIESHGFDDEDEPKIGRVAIFSDGKICKIIPENKDPMVYHHKWMFVADDYQGFCVGSSKKRSLLWKEKLGVDKNISSRIGRSSFWEKWKKIVGI